MKKKVTMRDIAKQADVALSTVSQVLNNKSNVAVETRQHVLEVANQLGYTKPRFATHHTALSTIGLLTKLDPGGEPMLANPFYSQIIISLEQECQRNNLHLMYANVETDDMGRISSMPPMLLDEVVDGVIVVGGFLEESLTDISQRAGRNIVLLDGYTSDIVAMDSVLIDNYQGAALAVSHLIEQGHRNIGLIGSNDNSYPSIFERRESYIRTLHQYGIKNTFIEESNLHVSVAYEATIRLMQRHPDITAIFACNDSIAVLAVVPALQSLNLSVPADVSVIGFDDIEISRKASLPLTTIHVDRELIGRMGVQKVIERATNPERSATKSLVSTYLVERDSVQSVEDALS